MGRELRRVPQNWQHPKNSEGHYIPLHDGFNEALTNWVKEAGTWSDPMPYEEYAGNCPDSLNYMPDWPTEERTHYQMYETCTEGTPISPVMATPEALAHWLADNDASACGKETATYEQWLATIQRGSACSMVLHNGVLKSGVAAEEEFSQQHNKQTNKQN